MLESSAQEKHQHQGPMPDGGKTQDQELQELVERLRWLEERRRFVGWNWFRDQYLPQCGLEWAKDAGKNETLLQRGIKERLLTTWRIFDPDRPGEPLSTIMVNRTYSGLPLDYSRCDEPFQLIEIRGGPISQTVIEDREDRI